jgi:DNA-binding NarL/FixJ family response regulator
VQSARILVADDHKEMRDSVCRCLEAEFQVVGAVADGLALLEAAAQLDPDVCLLDISMPKLNGIEVATQLKQRGSRAKVIFLTIHEDMDFAQAALKTGASAYVIKRRIASDLLRAIKEALAGRIFISSAVISTIRVDQDEVPKPAV